MDYTKEVLQEAVSNSVSMAGVLRYLGVVQSGGTQCHVKNRIRHFGIDFSHFTGQGHNKGKTSNSKKHPTEILVLDNSKDHREKTYQLVRALIEIGRRYECVECGVGDLYNGKAINLHVDHIDGNSRNNTESNLRFLCPNCHSQTPSYCRKK